MIFIEKVIRQFEKYAIAHALVGGHAVALHGAVRGTIDVDFVISWSKENLKLVEKALMEIGLTSRIPITPEKLFHNKEEYIKNKNLIAWNFINPTQPMEIVDIIITWNLQKHMIQQIPFRKTKVNVLAKKYLIAMKRASPREQDLIDAEALEEIS